MLNADGALFDSFCFLTRQQTEERLLLACKMKFKGLNNAKKGRISAGDIRDEYLKINKAVAQHLQTDFFVIMLGRCDINVELKELGPVSMRAQANLKQKSSLKKHEEKEEKFLK